MTIIKMVNPGIATLTFAAEALPLLVLPTWSFMFVCPLLVASTLPSTVAVLVSFVLAVVANVVEAAPAVSVLSDVKKTKAKPGAGTVTGHALFATSQLTIWNSSWPTGRPSDPKTSPKV